MFSANPLFFLFHLHFGFTFFVVALFFMFILSLFSKFSVPLLFFQSLHMLLQYHIHRIPWIRFITDFLISISSLTLLYGILSIIVLLRSLRQYVIGDIPSIYIIVQCLYLHILTPSLYFCSICRLSFLNELNRRFFVHFDIWSLHRMLCRFRILTFLFLIIHSSLFRPSRLKLMYTLNICIRETF